QKGLWYFQSRFALSVLSLKRRGGSRRQAGDGVVERRKPLSPARGVDPFRLPPLAGEATFPCQGKELVWLPK
ncbi:MAG: hypothetical protein ACP5D1_03270, partial [Bacteroidales bacterium]